LLEKFRERKVTTSFGTPPKDAEHRSVLNLPRQGLEIAGSAENPIQILIQKIQGISIRPVIEGVVEEYDRAA
jgi:hypothetical protein